ncbi:MAG: tetratricopeptide repeat protein [Acidobacteria bacterium]|nr:tetratricopeptide repeat protein [Acidobacteriota bacterium]
MKTLLTVAMLVGASALAGAQERLSDQLRKGIVQEEVNQNLPKAIEAYQAIVAQFDEERKTAAAALYRLAECSRKAGKREQALAAYQRVVREFSDQAALVESSRKQLTTVFGQSNVTGAPVARPQAGSIESRERTRDSLQREKAVLEERFVALEQRIKAGVVSRESPEHLKLRQRIEQLKQQLDVTGASQLASDRPQVAKERPMGSLEETRIEMEAAERRLAEFQARVERGQPFSGDIRDLQTQYQILKLRHEEQLKLRQANISAEQEAQLMTQRMMKSVQAEIMLLQERMAAIQKKIEVGMKSTDDSELLQIKRDLLGLQRKLDELRSGLKR